MNTEWQSIATAPPGKPVLIHYLNKHGENRIIKARFIERFTEESNPDCEEGVDEYSDEQDRYFYREGWWEMIDNWDEYGFIQVHEGIPDFWCPLPELPMDNTELSRTA